MAIWDFLGGPVKGLVGAVGGIIDDVTTTDEERLAAKQKLQAIELDFTKKLLEADQELFKAQRDVLVAEAKGESWLQRSWRPITMLVFVFIIFNNYVLSPYIQSLGGHVPTLKIPNGMWALLNVGVGGYITSRGVEKVVRMRGMQKVLDVGPKG